MGTPAPSYTMSPAPSYTISPYTALTPAGANGSRYPEPSELAVSRAKPAGYSGWYTMSESPGNKACRNRMISSGVPLIWTRPEG
jgi:hypothetical protein